MPLLIYVRGQAIRTDWIERIVPGDDHGVRTCSVWFYMGSVGVYHFQGEDAETALQLLATHPALGS